MPSLEEPILSRDALTDQVYARLRAQIMNLRLEPGRRLNIDQLSRELRVSATPIREALNRLASERVVQTEPFRGFRVERLLNRDEIRDLFDARAVIEIGAISTSVERLGTDDHDRLAALVEETQTIAGADDFDFAAFNAADEIFHRIIVAGSGNSFLLQAWEGLNVHAQIARNFEGTSSTDAALADAEHCQILAALVARDVDATRIHATRHIHRVCSRLNDSGGLP